MSNINIHILGDKTSFYSKSCLNKFKLLMKTKYNNYKSIYYQFIKPDYNIELIEETETDIKFNIIKQTIVDNNPNKELLKNKLKMLKRKTKSTKSSDIPDDITKQYNDLKKLIPNIPIPEPTEILSDPTKYKEIISGVLNNSITQKLGQNHPYIKYFKSLLKIINQNNNNINNNNNLQNESNNNLQNESNNNNLLEPILDINNIIKKDTDNELIYDDNIIEKDTDNELIYDNNTIQKDIDTDTESNN
jgi:hypothetical protein